MQPLEKLEDWDDFTTTRYDPNRKTEDFRRYDDAAPSGVKEFYRQNHTFQTRDFVLEKKREYLAKQKRKMGIWEALDYLNTLVDDSDPDTDLSQIQHNLQTSEAIRHDGHPRWFVLINPMIIQGVLIASYVLTPNLVSTLLLPAAASLSLLILFGFSTALLWNGGREPQPGGQPA